jgi:NAD(P)-dependent dehydrogenase (short-subunit alcohol dehydrogenase family)
MVDDKFGLSDSIKQGALLGLGSVEDVSGMVKFLMSDNAKWITGRDFVIDGGYLMGGRE